MPVTHQRGEHRTEYWFRLPTLVGLFFAASLAVAIPLGAFAQTAPATCQDPNAINVGGAGPCVYNLEYSAQRHESATVRAAEQTGKAPPSGITASTCGITEFGCALVLILNWIADFLIYLTFPLGEHFLDSVIAMSFTFTKAGDQFAVAANIGWAIVLGVVNSLFVLVLLWVAIATIFDFEPFTARSLLPKLIIAALLINFSLPIGRSIINLSNGIAGIFVTQINQRWQGIGNAVSLILDPQAITLAVQNKYTTMNNEEARNILNNSRITVPSGVFGQQTWTAQRCYEYVNSRLSYFAWLGAARTQYQKCSAFLADVRIARALVALDPEYGKVTLLAGALVAKLTVAPIALFAVFSASVILLIRIISLTLLLIFGPFAFFGLILPYTRSYWSGWWEKLFRWSFFLPVFLFLFMLSLMVLQQIPEETKKLILAGEAVPDIGILFVNYLIGIGLMIASILVANQSSLYGASAVIGVGKKLAGAAGGWAKNRAWKFAGKLTEAAMKTPVLRQTIGRIAPLRAGATAVMKKGAAVEKKDVEFYTKLGDRQLAAMLPTMPAALRTAILGGLPSKRKGKFTPEGRLVPTPPEPSPGERQAQAIQGAVLPLIRELEAVRNLPETLRTALTDGIRQAIQNLPAGATPQAVTQAVEAAARNIAQSQPGAAGVQIAPAVSAIVDRGNLTGIEHAVNQAQRTTARAAQTDYEERIQELEERINNLPEERGRG